MESKNDFHAEPMYILERREVVLRRKTFMQVKVQWKNYTPEEAIWERENVMKESYPFLFQDYNKIE